MSNRIESRIARLAVVIILSLVALSTIYPMFFTLNASFKTKTSWTKNKFSLTIPTNVSNYRDIFNRVNVPRAFLNSMIITSSGVLGVLLVCILPAFAATKMHFAGRNLLFVVIIAGMMIPLQTILYPFYKMMSDFKLLNRYEGLILLAFPSLFIN